MADADDLSRVLASWPGPVPDRRLAPPPPDDRDPRVTALLDTLPSEPDGEVLNLFATLAHHPRLLKRWTAFGGTLLMAGELPDRDRELLILRTAWNCGARYEWAHHDDLARSAGLSGEEIVRVTEGPDAEGWSAADTVLLQAADELHRSSRITDETWAALAERYDAAALIEVCMVVGQYHLVGFTLNSLGIPLEDRYRTDE